MKPNSLRKQVSPQKLLQAMDKHHARAQLRHCQSGILTVVAEWFIYIYQLLPARERAHYYWLINIGQKIDI